jgi:hypothetical protein
LSTDINDCPDARNQFKLLFKLHNIVTPAKAEARLATNCAREKPRPGLRRDDVLSGETMGFLACRETAEKDV